MNIWCGTYKGLSSIFEAWIYGIGRARAYQHSKYGYTMLERYEVVHPGNLCTLERRDRFFENKDSWKLQTTSPTFSPYLKSSSSSKSTTNTPCRGRSSLTILPLVNSSLPLPRRDDR